MKGRPSTAFPPVCPAEVGGIAVGNRSLATQAEKLTSLTNRVLRRLHHELRNTPKGLPGAAWLETYRYIAPTILALLREQRERAALNARSPEPPLTDAELAQGMRELAEQAVIELPPSELEALLKRRETAA